MQTLYPPTPTCPPRPLSRIRWHVLLVAMAMAMALVLVLALMSQGPLALEVYERKTWRFPLLCFLITALLSWMLLLLLLLLLCPHAKLTTKHWSNKWPCCHKKISSVVPHLSLSTSWAGAGAKVWTGSAATASTAKLLHCNKQQQQQKGTKANFLKH